jgi:hypothetical protein
MYYQVYSVSTRYELTQERNSLIHENEDCKVIYNFWEQGGNPGFRIFNKTDRNIYIDLSNSFFINNNMAFDYYKNREFNFQNSSLISKNSSVSTSKSASLYGIVPALLGYYDASIGKSISYGKSVDFKNGESHGLTFHEKPIVSIPPRSEKYFSEYFIWRNVIRFCNLKQDYPKSSSEISLYQRDNSPVIFKNIISYFVGDENNAKSIENEFWVSEIINYTEKAASTVSKERECEYDYEMQVKLFSVSSPNKFYNTYSEKPHLAISNTDPMYP